MLTPRVIVRNVLLGHRIEGFLPLSVNSLLPPTEAIDSAKRYTNFRPIGEKITATYFHVNWSTLCADVCLFFFFIIQLHITQFIVF